MAYYPFASSFEPDDATNYADGPAAVSHDGAIQSTGFEPPLLASGSVLKLDGVAAHMSAPLAIRSDASFTVAAWAKPDAIGRSQVLVSQDGTRTSAFALHLDATGAWAFTMPQADSESAATDTAKGPTATVGEWAHLAGVFDVPTGELRLFVNGTKVATARHTSRWQADGQVQIGRGLQAGVGSGFVGGALDGVRAWSAAMPHETIVEAVVPAQRQRGNWCAMGSWLHAGGPEIKTTASRALVGTAYDRQVALRWKYPGVGGSLMQDARRRDWAAYDAVVGVRDTRLAPIFAYLNGLTMKDSPANATFRTRPTYAAAIDRFLLNNEDEDADYERKYLRSADPPADQQAVARALAIAADMRARPAYHHVTVLLGKPLVPEDSAIRGWSGNRLAAWLRYGGYPVTAPVPGSPEFRFEVESAKMDWSDCRSGDPDGTYTTLSQVQFGSNPAGFRPGPLAQVTRTAQHEWYAEVAAQAAPRNAIVNAVLQANRDMRTATEAMLEAQYEAWVAGQLLKWKKLWLSRPKTYAGYPPAADFTRVTNALAAIPTAVSAQLTIAQRAVTSANAQVPKADAAKQQAAAIATANGTPLYRGLGYAQQSVQVTKASAAAAEASSAAIQTTLNAVRATNADGATLQALAATQQAAQQAQFRRIAAQESAAQAKAAADAAAKQAAAAATAATTAKAKRAVAEQALVTARTTAERTTAQRQIAEQQRQIAATQRGVADRKHDEAEAADIEAQRQRDLATVADQDARMSASIAADKDADARDQARRAAEARNEAEDARRLKSATEARAAALDAAAAATEGTEDATEARAAADEAQAAADRAATAANAATANAEAATAAAVAAREAATAARAAATRARAAANAAASAAARTRAAAATAHSAAADALAAAHDAAADADAAKASAARARAEADKAAADSAVAQLAAADARTGSARTAGEAYAASAWASAARDAAATVIAPANAAIALGTPFQQTDASAGLAVLVGQEAKTFAAQQKAAAQACADEAERARVAAAAAAARATADAKAAAQAAADAATFAAAAAKSAAAAQASAAAAAVDAAAAAQADAAAAELAAQATRDAAAADSAADSAEHEADAADLAASAAERNAASAREAASQARTAAADAQAAADQADKDADEAEAAAADARASARAAEAAARQAEAEQNARDDAVAVGPNGPTGTPNVIAQPIDVTDDIQQPVECQIIDLHRCTAVVHHHLTGKVAYFVRTCPDPNTTDCPGKHIDDYLSTVTLDKYITETRILDPSQITLAFWKALAFAFVSDFVDCAHGKLLKCGIIVAEIVIPFALGAAIRAILGLRYALRAGRAIEAELAAVRAAGLEPAALSGIEKGAASGLAEIQGSTPAIQNVRARLAELLRRRTLGLDAATGQFRRGEMETALRIEGERGIHLTRSTGVSEDWTDQFGRTYDAVGNFPASVFEAQWPNLQSKIVGHLQKAEYVPIDVSQWTPAQIATVREFIGPLGARVFIVGG